MDRVVAVERDGVHVRIALERNPMPAGELTRVKTEVRNTGSDTLVWFHDGCATLVSVYGVMADDWRPGIEQTGVARTFKDYALDLAYRENPLRAPVIQFVPEWAIGKGSYGCADLGLADEIAPGDSMTEERIWDGQDGRRLGLPPVGPVTLTASFQFYWRERGPHQMKSIEFEVASFVTDGVDRSWLSPPEVVDAALDDRAFLEFLGTQNLGSGRDEILWYRPTLRAWEVGVLVWYEEATPTLHLVVVDPVTGEILDRVDRPWDEGADGFP
jgi:hypothetical protein